MPGDLLAGNEFRDLLRGAVRVLVTIRELRSRLSVAPSTSPDHHPRTLLMAAKASFGVWFTEMVVVKLRFFMAWSPFVFCALTLYNRRGAETHRCFAKFFRCAKSCL